MNCAVNLKAGVKLIPCISAAINDSDFIHDGKSDAAWIEAQQTMSCSLFIR